MKTKKTTAKKPTTKKTTTRKQTTATKTAATNKKTTKPKNFVQLSQDTKLSREQIAAKLYDLNLAKGTNVDKGTKERYIKALCASSKGGVWPMDKRELIAVYNAGVQSLQEKTSTKAMSKKTTPTKNTPTKQTTATKKAAVPTKKQTTKTTTPKQAKDELVTVEIRIHNDAKGGHPHVKVDTVGKNNVSVGLTHNKKKGKKHNNIPLQHNPLGGTEQAYMRKQGTVDKKANYGKKMTGQMTVTDQKKAQEIGAKAKRKHLDTQKKKR